MSQQHQNFDTTYTKIFVGGLPSVTRNEGLRIFFEQFGEIVHVNVVYDKATNRSKGYGFVTFKDAESATRACVNRNPIIDGGIANCNLASDGRNQYSPQSEHAPYAPQYNPQLQYNLQNNYSEYSPQYVMQYDPQYYQNYFVVNNTTYQEHQSTNM
ncbi:hypothetical protein EUTSA_v10015434mg [Eutrema salsugineum]|uniref:RRM domain-containing protein n=1 Tax=Eutrema salsugineum TaxID=72664 RepID=V4LKZ5_EUTSA|nr:hypothetical protein EUTSA_v10015434mg [Eutrema salsugineum]